MFRSLRAAGPPAFGLALCLCASFAGCGGGGVADEPAAEAATISPAEPGQTVIPDPDRESRNIEAGTGTESGTSEVPIVDEPETPGIGS